VGPERAGDKAEAADQQDQNHESVEERGRLKIKVHFGEDASQDKERPGAGEQPAGHAAAIPDQQGNAEQHGMRVMPKVLPP